MGSSGLISSGEQEQKVESTSLTALFEQLCPIYMVYGMSYDEYWFGEPYRAEFYKKAYKLKRKIKDEELWTQGMYIYEALLDVSPILHAFCSKGTKPLPYRTKSYRNELEEVVDDEAREQLIKNEQLKAEVLFGNWARATAKQFENKDTQES